ncbi:RDD family protein [Bacillus suaedae]|uniref:RDD family protein n=1 Tax=Halalkalibacter suaedae TaxID=2822140 RepID=A0A941APC8_9BACI|nr:RDD family protein [Bacillus suaedae]
MIFINPVTDSPVGITERGFAFVIDLLIAFGIALLLNIIFGYQTLIIAVFFSYIYEVFLPLFWNGYTVGKRIVGIRIAPLSGEKLTLGTMIIRGFLIQILYNITAGLLTIISIYFVSTRVDKRSIHDLVAQTYVTANPPES